MLPVVDVFLAKRKKKKKQKQRDRIQTVSGMAVVEWCEEQRDPVPLMVPLCLPWPGSRRRRKWPLLKMLTSSRIAMESLGNSFLVGVLRMDLALAIVQDHACSC